MFGRDPCKGQIGRNLGPDQDSRQDLDILGGSDRKRRSGAVQTVETDPRGHRNREKGRESRPTTEERSQVDEHGEEGASEVLESFGSKLSS